MTETDENNLPPCLIFIDKEGHWYHKGAEMIHREFIQLFYQNMELDSHGRYVIKWKKDRCYVDVEDTAFVVWRVLYKEGNQGQNSKLILYLSDDTQEELIPDTIFIGKGNVLYCKVKNCTFPARFNHAAYYQLAQYIEKEEGTYYLPFNGKRYNMLVTTEE